MVDGVYCHRCALLFTTSLKVGKIGMEVRKKGTLAVLYQPTQQDLTTREASAATSITPSQRSAADHTGALFQGSA